MVGVPDPSALAQVHQRAIRATALVAQLWEQMCQDPLFEEIKSVYGVSVDGDATFVCDIVVAASTQCADADELANFILRNLKLERCRSKRLRYMVENRIGRPVSYAFVFAIAAIALGFAEDAGIFFCNYRKSGSWGTWVELNYLAKERGEPNDAYDLYERARNLSDEAGMSESGDHYLPAPIVLVPCVAEVCPAPV